MSKENDISSLKYDVSNIPFHNIGDDNEPAFLNSWVNFNTTTYHGAGFRKIVNGIIELRGMISTGSISSASFILPIGYRPSKTKLLSTISNSITGRIDINSDGEVIPKSPSTNNWVSLDGIMFSVG